MIKAPVRDGAVDIAPRQFKEPTINMIYRVN